jgi:hypothetical protein
MVIRSLPLLCCFWLVANSFAAAALDSGTDLAARYAQEVDRRVDLPEEERRSYAELLSQALTQGELGALPSQYFVLIDRDQRVQAAMIYWKAPDGRFEFIGASPCSTGKPGEYEHFYTPTGVFAHTIANLDFRAEGTKNPLGARGYGVKGMRVYDFGWVRAERAWGPRGESDMRLQVHSTDPDLLEPRLGLPHSKGCVRIPAMLNSFIDRYAILDADYERALADGKRLWVLREDREPTPWSGRYLVIVDSQRSERPQWAPPPSRR